MVVGGICNTTCPPLDVPRTHPGFASLPAASCLCSSLPAKVSVCAACTGAGLQRQQEGLSTWQLLPRRPRCAAPRRAGATCSSRHGPCMPTAPLTAAVQTPQEGPRGKEQSSGPGGCGHRVPWLAAQAACLYWQLRLLSVLAGQSELRKGLTSEVRVTLALQCPPAQITAVS